MVETLDDFWTHEELQAMDTVTFTMTEQDQRDWYDCMDVVAEELDDITDREKGVIAEFGCGYMPWLGYEPEWEISGCPEVYIRTLNDLCERAGVESPLPTLDG